MGEKIAVNPMFAVVFDHNDGTFYFKVLNNQFSQKIKLLMVKSYESLNESSPAGGWYGVAGWWRWPGQPT